MISPAENIALDAIAIQNDAKAGERMLAAVYQYLGRFVAYPSPHAQTAHALWILHTHLMDRWDSTPRLAFLSAEPASGKTRALEVTELLVPRPVCAVNVSPAYLFRKVASEDGLPTILYDEIDTVFGPKAKENEEIRGLLNAGHRRGQNTGRCVMHGKTVVTEEIPAFSAVALAGLGWLPDTILSRAVIIRMRRRAPDEKVESFRRRIHGKVGNGIRDTIERWARVQPVEIDWPELPAEIQDRDADVWEPLIAVADLVGGEWPKRARVAAVALVGAGKEAEPSLGVRLLHDLREVFGERDKMSSKSILEELIKLEESPWGDLRGKPLDERGLARRLREYGVKSKSINIGTGTNPKGYEREHLHDAWQRYLPPCPAKSATSATSATVLQFQRGNVADGPQNVADVADGASACAAENPHKTDIVAHVADVADLAGDGAACAQCGRPGEPADPLMECYRSDLSGPSPLHRGCMEIWLEAPL